MNIIIFIILVILFFIFIDNTNRGNIKKQYNHNNSRNLVIICWLLILISGLRHEDVGLDTWVYKDFFDTVSKSNFFKILHDSRMEYLYILTNKIFSLFFPFVLLQLFTSAIFIFGVYSLIHKYSKSRYLSILFYVVWAFYYLTFNEMRQAIAIGIVCFNFKNIVEGKYVKYIVLSIISILFHYSAAIALPIILFRFVSRINIMSYLFVLGSFFTMLVSSLLLLSKLNMFIINTYGNNEETGGWGLLAFQVFTILICFPYRRIISNDIPLKLSFFMVCGAIVLFPFCHLNPAFFRLEQYWWIGMLILVPNLISVVTVKWYKNILILLYFGVGCFLSFNSYYTEGNQIFPYMFFWE